MSWRLIDAYQQPDKAQFDQIIALPLLIKKSSGYWKGGWWAICQTKKEY